MKCFEGYDVEHIKKMSADEVKVLWDAYIDEMKVKAVRAKLVEVLELEEVNSDLRL